LIAVKFVKDNGAKIAKVGLKTVAAATKIASHAAVFIPGIGKGVGKALSTISQVSDFASSKIPVKLSGALEKSMNVLEKVEHPLGSEYIILDTLINSSATCLDSCFSGAY
jgi:hypothetical protein